MIKLNAIYTFFRDLVIAGALVAGLLATATSLAVVGCWLDVQLNGHQAYLCNGVEGIAHASRGTKTLPATINGRRVSKAEFRGCRLVKLPSND